MQPSEIPDRIQFRFRATLSRIMHLLGLPISHHSVKQDNGLSSQTASDLQCKGIPTDSSIDFTQVSIPLLQQDVSLEVQMFSAKYQFSLFKELKFLCGLFF